jgi:hypothetical protein
MGLLWSISLNDFILLVLGNPSLIHSYTTILCSQCLTGFIPISPLPIFPLPSSPPFYSHFALSDFSPSHLAPLLFCPFFISPLCHFAPFPSRPLANSPLLPTSPLGKTPPDSGFPHPPHSTFHTKNSRTDHPIDFIFLWHSGMGWGRCPIDFGRDPIFNMAARWISWISYSVL